MSLNNQMIDFMEDWRDIHGFDGYYQISESGIVKSLKRTCKMYQGFRTVPEKILNKQIDKDGYYCVSLSKDGQTKSFRINRLVALTFITNPDNKPQVNHKDGIKANNHKSNLEWSTSSENNLHACRTGLKSPLIGVNHCMVKLSEIEAREIKYSDTNMTCKDVGLLYGVSSTIVCLIRNNKRWKHI